MKIIYVTGIVNEKEQRYRLPYHLLFTSKWSVPDVLLPNAVRPRLQSDPILMYRCPETKLALFSGL